MYLEALLRQLRRRLRAANSGTTNPIVAENALPGTPGSGRGTQANSATIDGYTSQVSASPGGKIGLHVTGNSADRYRVEVYRLGYYGGVGARLLICLPSCTTDEALTAQPPTPPPDPTTGYLDAGWPVTDTINVGSNWVSGEYFAKLKITAGPDANQIRMIPFIVYEATPQSPILVQVGVNTWEAYNKRGRNEPLQRWCVRLVQPALRSAALPLGAEVGLPPHPLSREPGLLGVLRH